MKPKTLATSIIVISLAALTIISLMVVFAMIAVFVQQLGIVYESAGICIKATSTHIFLISYKWEGLQYRGDKIVTGLKEQTFKTIRIPLHEVAGQTKNLTYDIGLNNTLNPQLDSFKYPESEKRNVPLVFAGSDGMRNLNRTTPLIANEIVTAFSEALKSTGFDVQKQHFKILTPTEEGFYEWAATNIIGATMEVANGDIKKMNVMNFYNTTLTMGVIPVDYGKGLDILPTSTSFKFYGDNETAYTNSFDCLGAEHFYFHFLKYLILKADISNEAVENPCALKGDQYTVNGTQLQYECTDGFLVPIMNVDVNKVYTIVGTGNPDQCLSLVQSLVPVPTCAATSDTPL
ncbi:hypothetical protein ACOME3_002179 [Neoechinorhynchus agilis]